MGFPPLVDLYGHLGRYAMQTDLANRPELQPYYSYEWRLIGNLGADLLVELLHRWLGLEPAIRLIVLATQALAAAGILLMSRALHGRITPFAIAALPLIYGLPFNYGFLNFSLGMALAMLAFTLWLHLRRGTSRLAAPLWLAISGLGVWVCHTYGWAFLGLLCGSTLLAEAIAARERPLAAVGRIVATCAPLLLPLIPMIVWRSEAGGLNLDSSGFMYKLLGLVSALRVKWAIIDVPSLFVVVALIYWAVRSTAVRIDLRLGIAALLCFAFFLILPKTVFGSAGADVRLVPYALICALLAVPVGALGSTALRRVTVIALGFLAIRTVTTGAAYAQYEARTEAFLPALDAIPRGARVAFFSISPCAPTWDLPVLDHSAGFAMARRSVFVNDQWNVPGLTPLTVHYPAAGAFAQDPSQFVLPDGCDRHFYPHLSQTLAQVPYDAFTHVWIIGDLPEGFRPPARLRPVPHAGAGALLAVQPIGYFADGGALRLGDRFAVAALIGRVRVNSQRCAKTAIAALRRTAIRAARCRLTVIRGKAAGRSRIATLCRLVIQPVGLAAETKKAPVSRGFRAFTAGR
ncbi:hypothetical protein [Erythrobacter sp. WG]|uniref:hypothetical protein n=1 Tax=Erythrobacter sp. WG TaxID=2985510 RepID=UPI00226FE0AD|nr:hypothetical protein [Erythrobacter sp. WG]MCX9148680.1 hypothetical protein [Erythrobacter sp. WG]